MNDTELHTARLVALSQRALIHLAQRDTDALTPALLHLARMPHPRPQRPLPRPRHHDIRHTRLRPSTLARRVSTSPPAPPHLRVPRLSTLRITAGRLPTRLAAGRPHRRSRPDRAPGLRPDQPPTAVPPVSLSEDRHQQRRIRTANHLTAAPNAHRPHGTRMPHSSRGAGAIPPHADAHNSPQAPCSVKGGGGVKSTSPLRPCARVAICVVPQSRRFARRAAGHLRGPVGAPGGAR